MTTEEQLRQARGLLSETSGWLTAWSLNTSDPALRAALRARRDKLDSFLNRSLFQEKAA